MRDPRTTRNPHQPLNTSPHSVPGVLTSWCRTITEQRHLTPTGPLTVPQTTHYLDRHLDWITRQEWVNDLHNELQDLHTQLRAPLTGTTWRRIGHCPNTIDTGTHTHQCNAVLLAPLTSTNDTIRCWACHRHWPRHQWLNLGDLLDAR